MIPEGTYTGEAMGMSIVQAESGAVMVNVVARAEGSSEDIYGSLCLVQKDGTVSQITLDTMKKCWGWDGQLKLEADGKFWFENRENLQGKAVEIVVVHEEYEGKTRAKVKYFNAPGEGPRLKESSDRNKLISLFGAKFRAISGVPAGKPKTAAPPKSAPKAAPKKTYPDSTQEEAWAALCEHNEKLDDAQKEKLWFDTIEKSFGNRDANQSDFTPAQWGQLKAQFVDELPM